MVSTPYWRIDLVSSSAPVIIVMQVPRVNHLRSVEVLIKLAQDSHYLRTAEFRGNFFAVRQHFPLTGAGYINPKFLIMRTGFGRRHAVAFLAVKSDIDFQRLRHQGTIPQSIENVLGIERTIEVTDTGVVATNNEVGATIVLPDDSVK